MRCHWSKVYASSSNSFLVVLLILTISCDVKQSSSETESADNSTEQTVTNNTSPKPQKLRIERKQTDCTGSDCTRVLVEYTETEDKTIKSFIRKNLTEIVGSFTISSAEGKNLENAMELFIQDYEDFRKEFPEASASWYLEIDIEETFSTEKFVTQKWTINTYTGGAHPNQMIDFINLSAEGEVLNKLSYFLKNQKEIRKIAESVFRKEKGLSADASLADAGFTFEKNKFQLSDNFGFTDEGLVLYYNSYEIAPYSEGPTALLIPKASISDFYRF